MKPLAGRALTLLGIAAFLALWQAGVIVTRPAPIRRVTLAFSMPRGGSAIAVVLGARREVLAREALSLEGQGLESSAASLGLWLGALQPTLLALPPGLAPGSPLRALVAAAQRDYGGGLEAGEVAVPAAAPEVEALARARRLQEARAVRPEWLPGPLEALRALAAMTASGELIRHVVASLFRVTTGFALAAALGIPLGLALGNLAWLSALTNAVIQGLRPISPIAWLPIATLALGGGDVAAVFLIFLSAFFPIAISTAAAVGTVDLRYRRSALNFGVRGLALARRVTLPASLPAVLTALRVALGVAWVVVVAAEMLGVESGLGYLVLDARNQLRYDRVVGAMIVIGLIGLLLDTALRAFERGELERRGLAAR